MSTLDLLYRLVGAQVLGDHLTAAVDDLTRRKSVTRREAYHRVTEQADAGDPAIIAATRQTWVRRIDVDPDEAPARRLYILERTDRGIFVAYPDIDTDPGERSAALREDPTLGDLAQGDELHLDVLTLYELEAWNPFEFLLPTAGGIGNVRPRGARKP